MPRQRELLSNPRLGGRGIEKEGEWRKMKAQRLHRKVIPSNIREMLLQALDYFEQSEAPDDPEEARAEAEGIEAAVKWVEQH